MAFREIENDPLPVPNGWFAVEWSHALRCGEVRPVHYFGQDMVLFRTRSGQARVLDPFCPHLGADLSHGGRVIGETIRCPFHGWQFDGSSGQCTRIPYCDEIPKRAVLPTWHVQEKNGLVFVWHHAEGAPPAWDFPALEEFGDQQWSEPRTAEFEIDCPVQDSHENNNDIEHFLYVHKTQESPPTRIEKLDGGRHYRMVSQLRGELAPGKPWELDLIRDSWGLGLTSVRMVGSGNAHLLMFASTTPIEAERSHSRWLLTCSNDLADVLGEEFLENITSGVEQDIPIWRHKVHRRRPVLCKSDKLIGDFRQWAGQFYSP